MSPISTPVMVPLITLPPIAGGLTFLVMLVGAVVFLYIGLQINRTGGKEVKKRAYKIRKAWFALLLVVGLLVAGVVLVGYLPYQGAATNEVSPGVYKVSKAAAEDPVVVNVTGRQWTWEIEQRELPADRPIMFRVTSADVNHGFGIYRDGELIAQVQAMPGYVNVLILRFERPGEYDIRCLEYCGAAHTAMRDRITIVERKQQQEE